MKKEKENTRRDFLKLAGSAAPAAAVVAAGGASQVEASEVDPAKTVMQDTAHTRAYLDSARF